MWLVSVVMASSLEAGVETEKNLSGLGTSFGTQRSYGTVRDSQAPMTTAGKLCSYVVHPVNEQDTLQGLAVRYNVTVSRRERERERERDRDRERERARGEFATGV